MVLDPSGPVRVRRPQLVGLHRRVQVHLGDPGPEVVEHPLERAACADRRPHEVVGEHDALRRGEVAVGEADRSLPGRAGHAEGKREVDRELQVDVEELRPQLHGAHVAVEVAHVEAPHDRPLDLGAAFPPHLVEVGVVPHVLDGAGEPAVAVEQARRVGDGAPAVGLPLRVQREVHADVLTPVHRRRVACPRAGHHQRRARPQPRPQRLVHRHVRRPRRPEVVTVDDEHLRVRRVPEPLHQLRHRDLHSLTRSPGPCELAASNARRAEAGTPPPSEFASAASACPSEWRCGAPRARAVNTLRPAR